MRDAVLLLTTFGRRKTRGELSARALAWFGAVGAAIGVATGGAWWLAQQWWPPAVAAVLVVAVDAACTGLLHYDGLIDSADGLLPHATRERRLEIMRSPSAGAFGVVVAVLVIAMEIVGLSVRAANVLLIVALWSATRAAVATVPAIVPSARRDGMAARLVAGARVRLALLLLPPVAVAIVADGARGATAILAAIAVVALVAELARRRVGGFSGDTLGASIVLAQTAGIVLAASKW